MNAVFRIPVAKPRLPRSPAITPYLEQIDAARWYSNFGPLAQNLQARLADHYGLPPTGVALVANATLGLELALKSAAIPEGALCLAPSWTFPASAHAIVEATLTPCFVDVDAAGLLTPAMARQALAAAPGKVGAVMPVSVAGQPIDPAPWEAFAAETGVRVVLDLAPAFDSAQPSDCLSVVSLHATKVLGVGEGGFIMSTDLDRVAEARRRSNFGFEGSREAQLQATNAKLSEYAAAVGLAGLDEWAGRREAWRNRALRYRRNLEAVSGASLPAGWGETWQSSTCVVQVTQPLGAVTAALHEAGVETRAWWGVGAHDHAAFRGYPRLELPMTAHLAASTLGLPFYIDMTDDEIDTVCTVLQDALSPHP